MNVLEQLKSIIKEKQLKVEINEETINKEFKDLGLDSLDVFDVIVTLEKKLNVHLSDEIMMSLKTVNDLILAIEKLIK